MTWQSRYLNGKQELLTDISICNANRNLFSDFFSYEENKLKRKNNLRNLDDGTYKTLYGYILKFRNVNQWFKNKAWKDLTKEDIKKVYDGLEDGIIKKKNGQPFEKLSDSYYSKIFKSKPFELAGKTQLVNEVIEFNTNKHKEVRFIYEDDFRKLEKQAYKPHHKLLFWLAWDIGENINSLISLKKKDCTKQTNPYTKEPEYMINLRPEILKRSRKPRTEITNYKETYELLEQHLSKLAEQDYLFDFDYRTAKKIIDRAVERAKIKCIPNGEKVTWKDLRSGMACDLLKKGWSTDEVNARLGHRPSSDEIDKYVNFLAIDKHTPKKKVQQFEMGKLQEELEEIKRKEKLEAKRNEMLQEQLQSQQKQFEQFRKMVIQKLKAEIIEKRK